MNQIADQLNALSPRCRGILEMGECMFVIETDPRLLGRSRTIDRERGMELTEITATYDEIHLVLKLRDKDVTIAADYRFAGENGSIIRYCIRNVGGGWLSVREKYSSYNFSSRAETLEIAEYIEEALKVFGLHHSLSPGQSAEVEFSKEALSYRVGHK